MIFPHIINEAIVQVDDRTRIDASRTFKSPDESSFQQFEIEPESGAGFFDVQQNKYLDWAYSTDGEKTITLRVATDGSPVTKTEKIEIISEADDKLFSNDDDLIRHEHNILKYTEPGRNSFLNKHREAQNIILDEFDRMGLTDDQGDRLTKADVVDVQEVHEWSKYLTLQLIFEDFIKEKDDVFSKKAASYRSMADSRKDRAYYRLDHDNDGTFEDGEARNMTFIGMTRR